jgi:hypothetical protein
LRRQTTTSRVIPAGSGRVERLDPFALPVRFEVSDHAADGRIRLIELHRERVVVRRAVRGIKMAVNLPVSAYLGVAIRIEPPTHEVAGAVVLVLEHRDPALSLMLFRAGDCSDIIAEWQSWGRTLGLPLLVAEADGMLREPFKRIGSVRVGAPVARRRRYTALQRRRPAILPRRWTGAWPALPVVHRGEREIIARE